MRLTAKRIHGMTVPASLIYLTFFRNIFMNQFDWL